MTELNFLWEFTSEWASEILGSSKLKYTEQSSHWAVDNCQSRKPVGTKCKLDFILFYFFKLIYNNEVVKFYSPFPNKNNKEGSGKNGCCELFSLLQMKMGACVMETLEVMCNPVACCIRSMVWWVRKWNEGNCLPVTWENVYKNADTACGIPVLEEEWWSGLLSSMLPMPRKVLIYWKVRFLKSTVWL